MSGEKDTNRAGLPPSSSGDLLCACKWRIIPRIHYTNFRKLYHQTLAFKRWFVAERFWQGRLWVIGTRHHIVKLDWRRDWVRDMFDA